MKKDLDGRKVGVDGDGDGKKGTDIGAYEAKKKKGKKGGKGKGHGGKGGKDGKGHHGGKGHGPVWHSARPAARLF
jgi:hypothetical protein